MVPPHQTGVMHSPLTSSTPPNLPQPYTQSTTTPPPGFDYPSAVDAIGEHMANLHPHIYQLHSPIVDQIQFPPNQDLTSLAAACCDYITYLTSTHTTTLDLTHRHLITLTTALLLYSASTRTNIAPLLLSPLLYHLTYVITHQHRLSGLEIVHRPRI